MRLSLLTVLALTACGDPAFSERSCRDVEGACVEVDPNDPDASLLEVVNTLVSGTTIVLGAGTFALDNQVTLRGADDIAMIGQGMDATTLDFSAMAVQANGVDAIAQGIVVQDFQIVDAKKDGLRIEDSSDVVIRRVRATWSAGPNPTNGGYGLYPVRSTRVLMEESEAFHASDAGVYVGQCVDAIVRDNLARANVAGLEIENTAGADVYGNLVEGNTGGLVVFDLPGNPVIGHDIWIHDNVIRSNNLGNFAPGGTVRQIPAGTGTFAMASRRVEVSGNTYEDNQTVDIALLSGLVVEGDPAKWAIPTDTVVNDISGLTLDTAEGVVMNFRTTDVFVHDNTHTGGGTAPDGADLVNRPLGALLAIGYGDTPVDTVLYDAIGESAFSATDPAGNSNDHHVCVGAATPSYASLDLANAADRFASGDLPKLEDLYRPASPFAPFDCAGFTDGNPVSIPTFAE